MKNIFLLLLLPICMMSCAIMNDPVVQADIQELKQDVSKTEKDVIKSAEQIVEEATAPNPSPVSPQ